MTAGVIAIAITTAPTSADTAVGVEAGVAVGDTSLDAEFVHTLESTLRSQFVGVEAALVRGRLVLSGFATPGVHTAAPRGLRERRRTFANAIITPWQCGSQGLCVPRRSGGGSHSPKG